MSHINFEERRHWNTGYWFITPGISTLPSIGDTVEDYIDGGIQPSRNGFISKQSFIGGTVILTEKFERDIDGNGSCYLTIKTLEGSENRYFWVEDHGGNWWCMKHH